MALQHARGGPASGHTPRDRIIWADTETTELDPRRGALLEVALVVTEADLTPVDSGITGVIHAEPHELAAMPEHVRAMHTRSGLLDEVAASSMTLDDAEQALLGYVAAHVPRFDPTTKIGAPLAGSNIKFDRGWFNAHMPEFAAWPHYRDICVSGLAETVKRFFPHLTGTAPVKTYRHRAADDIGESLAEYRAYLLGLGWIPADGQVSQP